eukprot:7061542-Pyramimonas_sp.AAC.1
MQPLSGKCLRDPKLTPAVLASLQLNYLALPCSDGAVLIICLRCNAYASHGNPHNLLKLCDGSPRSVGARRAWEFVNDGSHL